MTMDRRIPHVRDVFSDLRQYEQSPRARRKDGSQSIPPPRAPSTPPPQHNREASNNRQNRPNQPGPNNTQQPLTERDFRHLERHLSMKKTIRKQISRNLAQAFVEDPKVLGNNNQNQTNQNRQASNPQVITLTRAKISKSEQNFLDMLKTGEDAKPKEQEQSNRDGIEQPTQNSFWKFLGIRSKSKR
ncbi:uncharacterized protein LOC135392771 isoform X1 [Ornithodoros turicata]|uniref:Uncharacterized protein n=2 Tax=Ornithodoros turicata TaxID=34597 RepID=A0A2R5LF75_9ACAR